MGKNAHETTLNPDTVVQYSTLNSIGFMAVRSVIPLHTELPLPPQ